MSEDATDEEIIAALANLEEASVMLKAKRKALEDKAEDFFSLEDPKISENEANVKSKQMKDILRKSKDSITNLKGIVDI